LDFLLITGASPSFESEFSSGGESETNEQVPVRDQVSFWNGTEAQHGTETQVSEWRQPTSQETQFIQEQ